MIIKIRFYERWQEQRKCFHHDRGGNPANTTSVFSWIRERLIDTGTRKMFWCIKCQRTWFI